MKLWRGLLIVCCAALGAAHAADPADVPIPVVDAYIEVRTGPGIDFPVVRVVEKGQTLTILLHRPGWYKVRSSDDTVGWLSEVDVQRVVERAGMKLGALSASVLLLADAESSAPCAGA